MRIRNIVAGLLLFNNFLFASGYIAKIEAAHFEPKLICKTANDETKILNVGDKVKENDTLITSLFTSAQLKIDNLTIDIHCGSEIVVKQAIAKEKYFKGKLELRHGKLDVDFNSKKYNEKELIIDTNSITASVKGTKFTISYNGFISVKEGTVVITNKDDNKNVKILNKGESCGPRGPIIGRKREDAFSEPNPLREKKNPPEKKDKEPKRREPMMTNHFDDKKIRR